MSRGDGSTPEFEETSVAQAKFLTSDRVPDEIRPQAEAAQKAARSAALVAECKQLEQLVNRHGTRFPPLYLRHLPETAPPPAGPLTNAVIIAWFLQELEMSEVPFEAGRLASPSLRLLRWVFSGQQAAVWSTLKSAGTTGRAAAGRIEELIAKEQDSQRSRRGIAAWVMSSVAKSWLSLLPEGQQHTQQSAETNPAMD